MFAYVYSIFVYTNYAKRALYESDVHTFNVLAYNSKSKFSLTV